MSSSPLKCMPTDDRPSPPLSHSPGALLVLSYMPGSPLQYGKEYDFESPVKLLDCLLHKQKQREDEEVVMVSQVRGGGRAGSLKHGPPCLTVLAGGRHSVGCTQSVTVVSDVQGGRVSIT